MRYECTQNPCFLRHSLFFHWTSYIFLGLFSCLSARYDLFFVSIITFCLPVSFKIVLKQVGFLSFLSSMYAKCYNAGKQNDYLSFLFSSYLIKLTVCILCLKLKNCCFRCRYPNLMNVCMLKLLSLS